MRRRGAAAVAAVLSLAALAAVRSGGGGGPPLYDGICVPPQYKLLGSNPAPPSASQVYTGAELAQQPQPLSDDQTTPQAQAIMGPGTLAPAPGSTTVTLTVKAVPPPAIKPDGRIDGNVYSFEATSGGKSVAVAADHPVTVALGSTSSGGSPLTLEHLVGSHWTAMKTFPSGCGTTFDAASPSLGLFALVAQGSSSGGGSQSGSGFPVLLVIVIVVVVLAGAILGIRARRTRGSKRRRR